MTKQMKSTRHLSKITKIKLRRAVWVVGIILCSFFIVCGLFFMSQTQKMYSFLAQVSTENVPISESNCTNIHVGGKHIVYEKNDIKTIIEFPANAYIKAEIHEYQSNPDIAHKANIALACAFACAWLPLLFSLVFGLAEGTK